LGDSLRGLSPLRFFKPVGSKLKKNFYKVLGINKKADPNSIKKAYRKAAKQFHPDVYPKSEEKFKEIQEAYETLSNPEKRAIYDQEKLKKPIMDVKHYPSRYSTPIDTPFDFFNEIGELFSYYERSWMNEIYDFFGEREEGQRISSVEIILSPEEAKRGCEIPLKIPIWKNCRQCRGTGNIRGLICGLCRGRGEEELEKKIKVSIPSDIRDGMKIKIPLNNSNLSKTYIIATIKISW
jgi:molecular chaperone DnaJ